MSRLRFDALGPLAGTDNPALSFFVRHDLLDESCGSVKELWEIPQVQRILTRQLSDGRWRYSGGNPAVRSTAGYDQLETYRQLGVLICKFGLDRRHPAVGRAADFLHSFQTDAGDYRGIYGNQYSPNYTAAITELLILGGYGSSSQVRAALEWLLSIRQDDGGWAIPARTLGLSLKVMLSARETLEPDRSRPSSHLITGIVLRALAAHPKYRRSVATRSAGESLKARLFTSRHLSRPPPPFSPIVWL